MNISEQQKSLRDRIAGLCESHNEIMKLLWAAMNECREHVYEARGIRARCAICDDDGGWYCPDSPSHACEYDYDTNGENCVYCGEPIERK